MPEPWILRVPGLPELRFGDGEWSWFDTPPLVKAAEVDEPGFRVASSDGVKFGREYLSGGAVAFRADISTRWVHPDGSARGMLEKVRRAWRGDELRRNPGAVAELISEWGRSAFGRPREFAPDYTHEKRDFIPVDLEFATVSDLWFGQEKAASFTFAPGVGGGFTFPLVFPAVTTATSDRSQVIEVGGDLPTPHVQFEVRGPITNPVVEVVGVARLEFRTTLTEFQTLVVDSRPWVRSVMVGNGSRAGALTAASTMLSDLVLPPGPHEVALRGIDGTGLSSLTTRWRDAYTTP